ncbi:MAG TPA: hypothetical protein VNZ27_12425 [Rhodanobacter sp.]|nr:hypothetical protein [Rhodanobacter sp.]
MQQRLIATTWIMLALAAACAKAHAAQEQQQDLFGELQSRTNELSRYWYLTTAIPGLPKADQSVANQLLASSENELGLYSEAVRDFPLRSRPPEKLILPQATTWQAMDAVDTITALARDRRIVMVNEAHHDAHTRLLTLALLPRLRAMGFTHFAAEALDERDASLMKRGYPVTTSGSEYLLEPLYGDIVREAIKLGFVIVPYDFAGKTPQDREDGQAKNLYEQALAKDPKARLFVHAGYAHIDKQRGRLGPVKPMAMKLQEISGITPLSIDQTEIREENPKSEVEAYHEFKHAMRKYETTWQPMLQPLDSKGIGPGDMPERPVMDIYAQIVAAFGPVHPIVLLQSTTHVPWSARPDLYDVNVILPPSNSVPSSYRQGPIQLTVDGKTYPVLPPANDGHRPGWLTLDGQRVAARIDTESCARKFPCMVEAHYADESDDSTAADRYLFLQPSAENVLYLRPGKYRLRTADADNTTLNEHVIQIAQP